MSVFLVRVNEVHVNSEHKRRQRLKRQSRWDRGGSDPGLGMPEDFPSVTLGPPSFMDLIDVSLGLRVLFAGNAVITLLALWTILGTGRTLWRMPLLVLAAAAVGVAVFVGDYVPLPSWFLPTLCLGHALLLVGLLALLGLGDYRLVWRPYSWRATND